jgi:hypothetical protein
MDLNRRRLRGLCLSTAMLGSVLVSSDALSSSASASSTVTKTSHYTLTCNLGILGNANFTGSHSTATWPSSVTHGSKFTTTFSALTVIPASYSNKAYAIGGRAYSANIRTFNISTTDASPTTDNIAPFTIPKRPLKKNQPILLPTPIKGVFTLHLTAGRPGTIHVTLGNSVTRATVYNSGGFGFLTITATCQPPNPLPDLGTIKVT